MKDFDQISNTVSAESKSEETVATFEKESTATMVRDENGDFLFRKEWLQNYSVIDKPVSKLELQVVREPNFHVPAEGNPRYICNLKAIRQEDIATVVEMLKGRDYVKASEINRYLVTATIWPNSDGSIPELPGKGEFVNCNVDYVYSHAQDKDVLGITSVTVKKATRASKFNFDLFAE